MNDLTDEDIAEAVKILVKDFRYSTAAKLWHHVGPDIRRAFLDSEVMHLALSWSGTRRMDVSVFALWQIRRIFEAELEEKGIKRRGDSPLKYAIHD